jgi:hypothetical protein
MEEIEERLFKHKNENWAKTTSENEEIEKKISIDRERWFNPNPRMY